MVLFTDPTVMMCRKGASRFTTGVRHETLLLPPPRLPAGRDGEVTFVKELSYNYSYFQVRNLGTLVTLVTVTTIKI